MKKKQIKRLYNIVIVALFALALIYVCSRFVHPGHVEYTDDAQVHRLITPIHARVQGFIREVRFTDYQHIHRGDTLVILEDAEYLLQLAQAEASLRGSRTGSSVVSAGIHTTQSNVNVMKAGIDEARVNMENAQRDFRRFATLLSSDAVTRQQYDNAEARYLAAKARYEQATHQRQSTALQRDEQEQRLSQTHAGTSVAEAAVHLAQLNLSYTVIVATCDGVMGIKDIHVGQLVQPGQLVARIVSDDQIWITANYRERQMEKIHEGSRVQFTVDAIPGKQYAGRVQSISAATGSSYSSVPVDNATGNFVKVEQRVPVRIELTDGNRKEDIALLRSGMNAETEVKY